MAEGHRPFGITGVARRQMPSVGGIPIIGAGGPHFSGSRTRHMRGHTVPTKISLVFSVVMLLAMAMPVAAAPRPAGTAGDAAVASHVGTCDTVVVGADGAISVNGVALTDAQLALLSADVRAALQLAADAAANANADVCVDLAVSLLPLSVVVNADIAVCGAVVLTASSATVGGVAIPAELLSAGLRQALALAAAANVNACLTTTVTDNTVTTTVTVDACVQARLNSAGQVVVTAGGQEFVLAGFGITGTVGPLTTNAAVTVGLRLGGTVNLATDGQTLFVQVITIAGCDAVSPDTGTPPGGGTTPPPGGGTISPGGGTTPPGEGAAPGTGTTGPALLPDTAAVRPNAIPALVLGLMALVLGGAMGAARLVSERNA